ncbi:DpnD/PcfM family protein [Oceanobacillus sp. AG]
MKEILVTSVTVTAKKQVEAEEKVNIMYDNEEII